jgi:HlyD family secretion protein
MLLAFLAWSAFSQIDRVVVAPGRLVTPLPNIVVQPLEISIIQTLDVRVGQVVRKGERLATLDPTFAEADQGQLRDRLRSLDTQSRRLQAELSDRALPADVADADARLQSDLAQERQAGFKAQLSKIDENIARLEASLTSSRHDQEILDSRVKSLQEIEAMQENLVAQQFSAKLKLLEAREKRLEAERDLQLARGREAELTRDLASARAEKAAFVKSWRQKTMEDMLSTSRDRASLNEQLQKAERRRKMVVLTAPADAVVLDMARLSVGSVAREAEPLFTLVPLAATLEAEVQIDAGDVGYVKTGDRMRLKIDAFPFQRHGVLEGSVRTISEDAFRRDRAGPGATGDVYYLSRAAFDERPLRGMPEGTRLLPGMTLTAEIVVGKRTVLSYLLWPLTKALGESISEP